MGNVHWGILEPCMESTELNIAKHYHASYFNNFQKTIGEFGGKANKFMFEKHIQPDDVVLDFGCGGGFLLKNLNCREKIGVELNPIARNYCNTVSGIDCFESLDAVPDESVDVVISSHCLEHTANPVELISILYEKLKAGGKIVIAVPLDSYLCKWVKDDINNHLYSFSPMNLGNILQSTGFKDIEAKVILHKWVPQYKLVEKIFGFRIFHQLSWIYGSLVTDPFVQVKGVGIKKALPCTGEHCMQSLRGS
jgi:SAM-dependent methyltransferase